MEYSSDGDTLYALLVEADPTGAAQALPLVLLHPTPLDHRFWSEVLPSLTAHRLILPDLRGHGRSPLGRAAACQGSTEAVLTVEQLGRDTVALLDALNIREAILIGCSIGGYTLFELWRTVPERIAGLVFCASKPQADTDAERARRADWIAMHEAARLNGQQGPAPEFVEAMLAGLLSVETRQGHPERIDAVRSMMQQVKPQAIQAIQRGLGLRPDSRKTAATITVPTCVIAGEQDTSSRPEDMSALHGELQKGSAHAEYHLVPGAAHYVAIDQPLATGAILASFCTSAFLSDLHKGARRSIPC